MERVSQFAVACGVIMAIKTRDITKGKNGHRMTSYESNVEANRGREQGDSKPR